MKNKGYVEFSDDIEGTYHCIPLHKVQCIFKNKRGWLLMMDNGTAIPLPRDKYYAVSTALELEWGGANDG